MQTPYQMPLTTDIEDDLYIGEILRLIERRWKRTLAIVAVMTSLAIFYVLFSQPMFSVAGTLYLGGASSGSGSSTQSDNSNLGFQTDFQSNSDVQTQIQLLQANGLIERAVMEIGLNSPVTNTGNGSFHYWQWWLFHSRKIDAFAPKPGSLQARFATLDTPSGAGIFELITKGNNAYEILQKNGWRHGSSPILTGVYGQPASGNGLSLLIAPAIEGRPPPVGTKFTLQVFPAAAVADKLLGGGLTVAAGGEFDNPTHVATVTLRWNNPYQAKELINQVMNDYIATQLSWKTESASNVESFISNQLTSIKASLEEADQKLAAYQAQTGIIDVPSNAKDEITTLSQYEVQRTAVELQRNSLSSLKNDINRPSRKLDPYLVSESNDPVIDHLSEQLADEDAKLSSLQADFTENSEDVTVQSAAVAHIKNEIASVVNNDLLIANSNLNDLNNKIAVYQEKMKNMPAESLKIISLSRASDVLGQIYVLLMNKQQEAEVVKAAAIIDTRVVTPAQLPFAATNPRPKITIAGGLLMGLFCSFALILGERSFSGRFYSDEEIRRLFPLPVYGRIHERGGELLNQTIAENALKGPFPESFRMMRTNIYHSGLRPPPCVIAITSASSGDGKTTVAGNLAKTFADDGRSVILINADLHAPRPYPALPMNGPGLTEWLLGTAKPEFLTPPGQRFEVLATGVLPPNPSELLNGAILEEIIEFLKTKFEFIIIDCPPLPIVADSMVIGQKADLILSVVRIDHTRSAAFKQHCEALQILKRRHGIVVNGCLASRYGYGSLRRNMSLYGYGVNHEQIKPMINLPTSSIGSKLRKILDMSKFL